MSTLNKSQIIELRRANNGNTDNPDSLGTFHFTGVINDSRSRDELFTNSNEGGALQNKTNGKCYHMINASYNEDTKLKGISGFDIQFDALMAENPTEEQTKIATSFIATVNAQIAQTSKDQGKILSAMNTFKRDDEGYVIVQGLYLDKDEVTINAQIAKAYNSDGTPKIRKIKNSEGKEIEVQENKFFYSVSSIHDHIDYSAVNDIANMLMF